MSEKSTELSFFIPLPQDEWGKMPHMNFDNIEVISAEVEEMGMGQRLHIRKPRWLLEKWPTIRIFTGVVAVPSYIEVGREPGPISREEYRELVQSIPGLPDWVYTVILEKV